MRILVVYWWPPGREMRVAVEQHLRALDRGGAEVEYVNAAKRPGRETKHGRYDGIVLHTTFLCLRWSIDFAYYRRDWRWLSDQACPIVALPQDEYRHAEVLDEWLDELGADVVFSCFDERTRAPIYERTRAAFRVGLTGYLDPETAAYCDRHAPPPGERPFDVVYRAEGLPYWFGSHGRLKQEIGTATAERAPHHGLRVDISTRPGHTLFGTRWLDFVMSGRAIVGCESGSSVLDRRGEIQRQARELLALDPAMSFAEFDRRMPSGWDSWAFFAISPRHFEAVLARTCQVLVEGSYSGVLEPNRHYLPVRRDLSDLDEALERLRDTALVREVAERAYQDVYVEGTWKTDDFAGELVEALRTDEVGLGRRPLPNTRRSPVLGPRPSARLRLRRAALATRALAERPRLAKLVVRSLLAKPSDLTVLRPLARDLLRLGALDAFERYQRARGGNWSIRATLQDEDLQLVTTRDRAAGDLPRGTHVSTMVWDHSRCGEIVALSPESRFPLEVALETGGRWHFEGLSRLAARRPELDWGRALLIARSGGDPLPSPRSAQRRDVVRGLLSRNRNPDSEATK